MLFLKIIFSAIHYMGRHIEKVSHVKLSVHIRKKINLILDPYGKHLTFRFLRISLEVFLSVLYYGLWVLKKLSNFGGLRKYLIKYKKRWVFKRSWPLEMSFCPRAFAPLSHTMSSNCKQNKITNFTPPKIFLMR